MGDISAIEFIVQGFCMKTALANMQKNFNMQVGNLITGVLRNRCVNSETVRLAQCVLSP